MKVAILGAGIMGCATALLLARRGIRSHLFDAAPAPCAAASRWNEGKIHLGYLYSADPSLDTARHILPGALAFKPLLESLIGTSLEAATTASDDLYFCHRDSVVPPADMHAYFDAVTRLVRAHPHASRYLIDVTAAQARPLARAELAQYTDAPEILAGFRVPERSVSTLWVADRLAAAVAAEPCIEPVMATKVEGVRRVAARTADAWEVRTAAGVFGPYDKVVNALWEGRLAVDATAGLPPPAVWSHRYRLALFIRTRAPVRLPCGVVATGPYGDVKNYNDRDFYLSWYPVCLQIDSTDLAPPPPPMLNSRATEELVAKTWAGLGALLPFVTQLREQAEHVEVRGGWVYAAGRGPLSNRTSTLHRRADFTFAQAGNYVSIDTGKYASAPWLAARAVEAIAPSA